MTAERRVPREQPIDLRLADYVCPECRHHSHITHWARCPVVAAPAAPAAEPSVHGTDCPSWDGGPCTCLPAPAGRVADQSAAAPDVASLIAQAGTWGNSVGTHWDGCEDQHYSCMIHKLAVALEAMAREVDGLSRQNITLGNECESESDRADKAEAERDSLKARIAALEGKNG